MARHISCSRRMISSFRRSPIALFSACPKQRRHVRLARRCTAGAALAVVMVVIAQDISKGAAPLLEPSDPPTHEIWLADFTGDGRSDLAMREFATGNVSIHPAVGSTFAASALWSTPRSVPDATNWDTFFADVDCNGRADLINRLRTTGELWLHYNNGSDFSPVANSYFSGLSPVGPGWRTLFGDVNGDGCADLMNVNRVNWDIFVHFNNTAGAFAPVASFAQQALAVPSYPFAGWEQLLADLNGDGKADFVNFNQAENYYAFHVSQGSSFAPLMTGVLQGTPEIFEKEFFLANVGGDGRADVVSHDSEQAI